MTRYDDTGPNVSWQVKVGDPITKTWDIAIDGTPLDISSATCTGAVRASEDSTLTAVATFTMTKPSTTSLKAYHAGISTVGNYWWAIKVDMGDGTVYRGQGLLIVEPKGV